MVFFVFFLLLIMVCSGVTCPCFNLVFHGPNGEHGNVHPHEQKYIFHKGALSTVTNKRKKTN